MMSKNQLLFCLVFSWLFSLQSTCAFSNSLGAIRSSRTTTTTFSGGSRLGTESTDDNTEYQKENEKEMIESISAARRNMMVSSLSLVGATTGGFLSNFFTVPVSPANAEEEEESFASIAARANKISKEMETSIPTNEIRKTDKTIYDFSLPIEGTETPMTDIIRKTATKAILVVNIKQDDPVARKDIPELISLVTKYGRTGEFVVVCCPTDQGYFEPDTSTLIRLKLATEYGYGINPATVLTDKVNLLGTGAHPFWRWLEGTCRTPAGLGRVEGNFEKFLIDAKTGLPVRRYPRKYMPLDIRDDIEAVLANRPLPPPGANFAEEWRAATKEAEADTYRFEKGLNVFDQ